jgi:DNA ligase (NAD+)
MRLFDEAKEIVTLLKKASDTYYNKSDSIISDAEYDQKKDRLIMLYEKVIIPKKSINPALVKEVEDFLNQIGAPVSVSEWKKAKHKIPMTSLNKVKSEKEFIEWCQEIGDQYFTIFDKMDGGSIDIRYENGKLTEAITRGDGIFGELITQNVIKMKNVKSSIHGFTGNLKGEIFMLREDFDALNSISDREYKNPRNTATGLCKTLDGVNVNLLSVLFYDIEDDNYEFFTEEEKLLKIESYGLKTCFWKKVTAKEAIEVFNDYEANIRITLPYDIDGIVSRADSISKQVYHGMLGGNPKAKIAWKFKPMQKWTYLRGIEWHIGGSRRITPIGLLEPTPMGGVTIKRCSLHNVDMFKKFNFTKDCEVLIERANEVIPYLLESKHGTGIPFEIPTTCPECGGDVKIDGAYLICTNDGCSGLGTGNLKRWVNELNIDELGQKLIQVLYDKDLVKEPADFYKLSIDQIANLDRMGEKSATKVITNLRAKMKLTLPELIAGLNMPNFSRATAETLIAAGYDNVVKMFNAQVAELIGVKGIGEKTAEQIVKGMRSKAMVIKNLFDAGISIKELEKVKVDSNKLSGQSYLFTGAVQRKNENGERYTRKDMENFVIENGGIVANSVNKELDFLVQADIQSISSKSKKAKELNISIISENDFFKKLENL